MPHSPTCSGCPTCSELALAILKNPTNPILRDAMANTALRAITEARLLLNRTRKARTTHAKPAARASCAAQPVRKTYSAWMAEFRPLVQHYREMKKAEGEHLRSLLADNAFALDDDVMIEKAGDPNDGESGTVVAIVDGAYLVEDQDGNELGTFEESQLRAATTCKPLPDPYATTTARTAHVNDDENYDPFGTPVDSYALALKTMKDHQ